eukprot:CAMPEP_0174878766 /NCGR_PEP_ID=MMETSP1114-20130205/82921_1 /TAXON_ID=312471 /ORGANISM="Neobodo designis, Strain CCAP 1951/1" /LENGTH=1194 /DNA_ID=CAMNT_0016114155 /DNA_START=261 /DNA_END=3845 /DNA_ORIENTATION=-
MSEERPFGIPPESGAPIAPEQAAFLREHAQLDAAQAAQVDNGVMPALEPEQLATVVQRHVVGPAAEGVDAVVNNNNHNAPFPEGVAPAAFKDHVSALVRGSDAPVKSNLDAPLDVEQYAAAARTDPPFKDVNLTVGDSVVSHSQQIPTKAARAVAGRAAVAGASFVAIGFSLPLLIFEILRDFWQILSLVISISFTPPFTIGNIFGRFAFAINFDIALLLPDIAGIDISAAYHGMWIVLFLVSIGLTQVHRKLIASSLPDPRREFTMLRTWVMMDRSLVLKMRAVTFLLTLLYLPVTQYALEILVCSHKYEHVHGHCPGAFYVITAIIAIIAVTIFLPVRLFYVIQSNVPKERLFDATGEPNQYAERDYLADLAKKSRKNPVASLFNEYNRGMRFHKVTIMALKCYLILVAVLLSGNVATGKKYTQVYNGTALVNGAVLAETPNDTYNHVRPALMIFGLLVYTLVCVLRRPFIATLAHALDVFQRVFAMICIACAYMIMFDVAPDAIAWVFNGTMFAMFFISILFIIASFEAVQEKFRFAIGDVRLTPVSANDPTPKWFKPELVDFARQRKPRVWQDYWTNLLVHQEPFALRPPERTIESHGLFSDDAAETEHQRIAAETCDFEYVDNDDTVAYLLDFKGSVAERHMENIEIAADVGAAHFESGLLKLTASEMDSVVFATRQLHGRDCYVNRPGKTHGVVGQWGCLYVMPMPYECFFAPDDDGPEIRFTTVDMEDLIRDNSHPEIQRQRRVREQLRGLALECERGYQVYFHITRQETISTGKNESTEYTMTRTHGTLRVRPLREKPIFQVPGTDTTMSVGPGFTVEIEYKTGTAAEKGGQTINNTAVIGHEELGIFPDLRMTEQLDRLINGNLDRVKKGHFDVLRHKDCFRRYFMSEFLAKALTLSYAFWPAVFNNDRATLADVRRQLGEYEHNPQLRALAAPEKRGVLEAVYQRLALYDTCPATALWVCFWHDLRALAAPEKRGVLEAVYQRLALYDTCPATALWVCFWHDLYTNNLDLKKIAKDEDVNGLLNPYVPTSIVWNPVSMEKCCEALRSVGLQSESGGGFIRVALLNKLYGALGAAMQSPDAGKAADASDGGADSASVSVSSPTAANAMRTMECFEPMRHPAYGAALVPCTMDNFNHPGLQLVVRLGNGATNSFYDDDGNVCTHYQRYPIVADTFGGRVPDDAYVP